MTSNSTAAKPKFAIRKASISRVTVRAALISPPGGGKSYSALLFARGLAGPEGRICVIDTEKRADNYAPSKKGPGIGFEYDVLPLESPHSPERYKEALDYVVSLKYDVAIVDSLSHEWMGEGGVLQKVDNTDEKNKFFAWKEPSKLHKALLEAIVGSTTDVICTIRTKIAYEIQDQAGKKVPKRIGLAPIQREGVEYEFDLVLGIDQETHAAEIQKCNAAYHGVVLDVLAKNPQVTKELGAKISAWRAELGSVVPADPSAAETATAAAAATTVTPTTQASATQAAQAPATPATPAETAPAEPQAEKKPRGRRGKAVDASAPASPQTGAPAAKQETPFESYQLVGTKCPACGEPQRKTPGGLACLNGHAGAQPSAPAGNAQGAPAAAAPTSTTQTPSHGTTSTPGGTPPSSPSGAGTTTGSPANYTVDDSVYDIAEVATALAAEIKAVPREAAITNKLWKAVHGWLLTAVGDKDAAMKHWADVGVKSGSQPTGAQVQTLVFNVATVKITNPRTKKE